MGPVDASHLADTMADVARRIHSPQDLDTTLRTIVESAAASLPGIDAVSITLAHHDGRMETKVATDQLVWDLDRLQYELREGPCVYAIDAETVVKVEHADTDPRWPAYMKEATSRGVRSQMGLQLYVNEETIGGLNMYSLSSDTIDPELEHAAELFATHAALALGHARLEGQLREAMESRQLIGQATGILMERYQLDEKRAFDYLIRVSSHSNTKLRVVAREVVDQTVTRATATDPA